MSAQNRVQNKKVVYPVELNIQRNDTAYNQIRVNGNSQKLE